MWLVGVVQPSFSLSFSFSSSSFSCWCWCRYTSSGTVKWLFLLSLLFYIMGQGVTHPHTKHSFFLLVTLCRFCLSLSLSRILCRSLTLICPFTLSLISTSHLNIIWVLEKEEYNNRKRSMINEWGKNTLKKSLLSLLSPAAAAALACHATI